MNIYKRASALTYVEILTAIVALSILTTVSIPSFIGSRRITKEKEVCIENLRQMHRAVARWTLSHNKSSSCVPNEDQIFGTTNLKPICPSGGQYKLGSVDEPTTCTVPLHELPKPKVYHW